MRKCLLCGRPLPRLRWWQRFWLLEPPPFHDPDQLEGYACWRDMHLRAGFDDDEIPLPPDPSTWRRRRRR